MGTTQGGGLNGPAPFLTKTYEMVDDPLTDSMVSWSHSGCSFVVWKPPEFTQYLLPSYFKHGNFSSFVRQLNTYGFKKIHPYQWEFANVGFIRGQKSLLMNIHRRKPIHSHSTQNQEKISPLTETERLELEDEIKLLKHENAMLELKLESYGRDKQGFEFQTQALIERLQSMERRQMQLMPFLAQQIKKPGFASILAQRLQHDNKRRRISESDSFQGLHKVKEDQTSPDRFPVPLVNFELVEKLDSSLKFWENVFYEVGDNFGQEVSSFGIMSRPSPVNVGNLSALSGEGEPSSPVTHPSSNNSGDIHSSSEPAGYVNDADHAMPAGANDQFWQSFLTEAPGSSVMSEPEHQSEKKTTTGGRTSETMPNSGGRLWWNANNIDDLTKNMGLIGTPERT